MQEMQEEIEDVECMSSQLFWDIKEIEEQDPLPQVLTPEEEEQLDETILFQNNQIEGPTYLPTYLPAYITSHFI